MGCHPGKIFGTILEGDQRIRKLMTMHKVLHPRDDVDRRRKEGGRGLTSIEDSVDTSIQRLEDYIEMCVGKLITVTGSNSDKTRTNRTEIAGKQKWEKAHL